jgi:hypothetical protein
VDPEAGVDSVEERNVSASTGIDPRFLGRQVRSLVITQGELSLLFVPT